jgi:hypothetical protein
MNAILSTPAIELVRLCRKVDLQVTYARWIAQRLVEMSDGKNGDGMCMLEDMLTSIEILADDLEGAAEKVVNACAEHQSARDRAEGRADGAIEQLKATAKRKRVRK